MLFVCFKSVVLRVPWVPSSVFRASVGSHRVVWRALRGPFFRSLYREVGLECNRAET